MASRSYNTFMRNNTSDTLRFWDVSFPISMSVVAVTKGNIQDCEQYCNNYDIDNKISTRSKCHKIWIDCPSVSQLGFFTRTGPVAMLCQLRP